jgi:gas vesicle protein
MGTFLIGLVIGAVAGGAVVFVYKKKIEKTFNEQMEALKKHRNNLVKEVGELKDKLDK